jgi:hypothetical protein
MKKILADLCFGVLVVCTVGAALTSCDPHTADWRKNLAMAKAAGKTEQELCFSVLEPDDIAGRYCLRYVGEVP